MAYVMESLDEAKRLEEQALSEPYSPSSELNSVSLPQKGKVLDAGCGTGLLSRAILKKHPHLEVEGCDFSDIRVQQAKKISKDVGSSRLHFFQGDLTALEKPNEEYDFAISRYVFEHLPDPMQAMRELHRVLKPKAHLAIIDFDGLILNLHAKDSKLMEGINLLKNSSPVDLFVGRKISGMMQEVGFTQIKWTVSAFGFQGKSLEAETSQMDQRFSLARPLFIKIFGSEAAANDFHRRYLAALADPASCLFVNKFTVEGRKN